MFFNRSSSNCFKQSHSHTLTQRQGEKLPGDDHLFKYRYKGAHFQTASKNVALCFSSPESAEKVGVTKTLITSSFQMASSFQPSLDHLIKLSVAKVVLFPLCPDKGVVFLGQKFCDEWFRLRPHLHLGQTHRWAPHAARSRQPRGELPAAASLRPQWVTPELSGCDQVG